MSDMSELCRPRVQGRRSGSAAYAWPSTLGRVNLAAKPFAFAMSSAGEALVENLYDATTPRVDQHRVSVDDRVAISGSVILWRHVVVDNAAFRQKGADPKFSAVCIRGSCFAAHIFPKTRPIIHAQNTTDRARCGADRPADKASNRSGRSIAGIRTFFRATNCPLRMRCDRQRK